MKLTETIPAEGTFDWMTSKMSARAMASAFEAVTQVEGWPFLETFSPPKDTGFMFLDDSASHDLRRIRERIHQLDDDHTLFTYGWTMRQLEFIAKQGWEAWVAEVSSWEE